MELNIDSIEFSDKYDNVSTAIVGGYVRDKFIQKYVESPDIDLVVTGVNVQDMLDMGFHHIMSNDTRKPVFKDDYGREVAIARSEKSTGDKHDEFEMDIISPDIPHEKALKIDLKRRDLTINAMAIDVQTGELFDPFNGVEDIKNGLIRHVSNAFTEDLYALFVQLDLLPDLILKLFRKQLTS